MKAYYYDDKPGDQRLPHVDESSSPIDQSHLSTLGIEYQFHPTTESVLTFATSRSYINRDEIKICPESFGGSELYDSKLAVFFDEHIHEDEEIRYIIDGSGYFDVRDHPKQADSEINSETDKDSENVGRWIRIWLEKGDLIVLPSGIYHRFTPDGKDFTHAMRLFKQDPKWTPLSRSDPSTKSNPFRVEYEQQYGQGQPV